MTTKEEIAYINYSQQISYGKMMIAIGEKLELGQNYSVLFNRIRVINQLQALFESEYGKDLNDTDVPLLRLIVNAINTLINDYRLEGEIVISESIIATLPNTYSLLVISNIGQQISISPEPELNGQNAFSTGGAYILKLNIDDINQYLDSLATIASTGDYNDLINKPTIPSVPVTSVAGRIGDVVLNKSDVGLSNVDNTSDLSKPISNATQSALNLKTDDSTLATIAKTGSYNDLVDVPPAPSIPVTSVAGKIGAVTLNKTDVGLSNVDNTDDLSKPISLATQSALQDKVDKEVGKGLSQENYTTSEKSKLASIVQNYRGKFTSLLALQSASFTPPLVAGNYATVDTGVGSNVKEYIWDDSDLEWVETAGSFAGNFSEITGSPYDNSALQSALDSKQPLLGFTAVPNTRTINGKALSGNITLNSTDLGLASEFYNKTEISNFFGGITAITGYNKANWDTAYSWGNPAGVYLPLSGGTLTGNLHTSGNNTWNGRNAGYYRAVSIGWTSTDYGSIGYGFTHGVTGDIRQSEDPISKVIFRGNTLIYSTSAGGTINSTVTWTENTVLHSGNFNSYVPALNGAGATGTWGINITGSSSNSTLWRGQNLITSTEDSNPPWLMTLSGTNSGIIGKSALQTWLGLNNGSLLNNNISGSAAHWNGYSNDYSGVETNPDYIMVFKSGVGRVINAPLFMSWLGLGSYAYRSSGLAELTGATFSGAVGVNTSPTNAMLEVARSTGEIFRADASSGAYRIIANQTGVYLGGVTNSTTLEVTTKLYIPHNLGSTRKVSIRGAI